jgi:hypothetical protein
VTVGLPADRLYRRLGDVKALLGPILEKPERFDVIRLPQAPDYTIGLVPRGYAVHTVIDPSSLRLASKWESIYFNYHETWRQSGKPERYLLDRAYLHFYLRDFEGMEELQALSLHCDPALEKADAHYRYRRGPHFHVGGARPNIDRAHLSLCVSDNALGGNNLGSLTRTLRDSLGMVIREVIPHYTS